ncbi:ABC transporter ATP-binding protein [Citricoccus sp.]|uniref:ABC transporter ATP-binding protein n=1 Tax=Citricoccus sp. TaxID=1978372 RepID=UPI0026114E1A|nr:ABC transporter ATP-binding protein [Citricoccus sp.]HRO29310.1 ABC transporter ATP-binding protein [Citricoccus sp.]HRO92657.1 ABC transporter ATP-binding protein [Citricoccus sp.]
MSTSARPSLRRVRGEERSLAEALRRLSPYLEGIRWRWGAGLASAMLAGLVALAIPQVIQQLVNSVLRPGGDASDVWTAVAIMTVLGVAEGALVYLRRVFILPPAAGVENRARVALFRRLQRLPVSFHDSWPSGQLLSRSVGDLSLLRRWIAFGTVMFVVSIVTIVVGLVLLFATSWVLALIYLAGAVPIMWRSFHFRNDFRAASRLSQDQAGDLATTVEESVHGIRVLKAFGRGGEALEGFRGQADTLRGTEVHKAAVLSKFISLIVALPETVIGLSLGVGIYLVATGDLTVGAVAGFFATTAVLGGPVESVGQLMGMSLSAKTAIDRHAEVMDTPVDIADPVAPRTGGATGIPGALAFRGVRFRYPDVPEGAEPLLRDITLDLRPGETMALVGLTGSGKSTLVQLVPRLYDVTAGQVLVGGRDVREYELVELRRRVSIAFEDSTLFSDSIRNNVLLGAPEQVLADPAAAQELLDLALDTAQAQFARRLPEGLDTEIGEEGLSLSGGQRQRIALARAIAARPEVLVLDDPLSALDVRTEEAVTRRLRSVLAGTTTLIVAHRPSTVALADRVAVLQDGRILDVGTHAELLARSADYRFIISSFEADRSIESVMDSGGITAMTGTEGDRA